VHMGVDLSAVTTHRTLRDALSLYVAGRLARPSLARGQNGSHAR
jgi:hypothetical protein